MTLDKLLLKAISKFSVIKDSTFFETSIRIYKYILEKN